MYAKPDRRKAALAAVGVGAILVAAFITVKTRRPGSAPGQPDARVFQAVSPQIELLEACRSEGAARQPGDTTGLRPRSRAELIALLDSEDIRITLQMLDPAMDAGVRAEWETGLLDRLTQLEPAAAASYTAALTSESPARSRR